MTKRMGGQSGGGSAVSGTSRGRPRPARALILEQTLPFAWHTLAGPPGEADLARLAEDGERLLHAALAGDEGLSPESDEPWAQAIERVDLRLALILDLLAELLAERGRIPAALPVSMGADHLAWPAEHPPDVGQWLEVAVYLLSGLPRPLRCVAQVSEVRPAGAGYRVQAEYRGLGAGVRKALERLIFRHHRRQVARARQGRPGAGSG